MPNFTKQITMHCGDSKILTENQKEMLKSIAPPTKKHVSQLNNENSDSEPEDVSHTVTLTPIKPKTTTTKTTSVNSRNIIK